MSQTTDQRKGKLTDSVAGLAIAALGVVYGDIGTSPLYAIKECFHGPNAITLNETTVMGILSLIFWSLIWLVSIKYILFVLRADNKGEGGILSLMALACPAPLRDKKVFLVSIGLFGAALLYGDGIITPAISVLSAVEGLNVATPLFQPYVDPITIVVLVVLFLVQKKGTSQIGFFFGPIMVLWFVAIGALGLRGILLNPSILQAMSPTYAFDFFIQYKSEAFVILSMVFLVLTGGEALYADMGHFGRRPIQFAWFSLVLPGLVLNYFGQGAVLLSNPAAKEHPFYYLAPNWALYPMVILATTATVIASQALISGVFSLTSQAIQMGYSPRMKIVHTSSHTQGQIYMPHVNYLLLFSTILLVLWFKSSSSLAAAYGLSVSLTMVITTTLLFVVAKEIWKWNVILIALVMGLFFIIDTSFFIANIVKFFEGGWLPILIGLFVFTLLTTWRAGRIILARSLRKNSTPLVEFINYAKQNAYSRVPGTAVFMVGDPQTTPPALVHNFKHNKILHEKVAIVSIVTKDAPFVKDEEKLIVETFGSDFFKITGYYGFMEVPDLPELLKHCKRHDIEFNINQIAFFLGRETLIPSATSGMPLWREMLFAVMSRNAQRATDFFNIPVDQVFEVGMQVEI